MALEISNFLWTKNTREHQLTEDSGAAGEKGPDDAEFARVHPGAFRDECLVTHEYLAAAPPIHPHPQPGWRLLPPPPGETRRRRREGRLGEGWEAAERAGALGVGRRRE